MNISNPMILKSLYRQQNELLNNSPEGIKVIINPEDVLDIQADITGPYDTPYQDGVFRVKLIIPNEFPLVPPKGFFLTKVFHPNVSAKGEICVNTLKKDWNPKQWSLVHVFQVVRCLLIIPFPESSLNEEAGRLFIENYQEYFKLAKIYTNVHSMLNNNDAEPKLSSYLSENNSRLNIRNNEKDQENLINQKSQSSNEVNNFNEMHLEFKKHSKSQHTKTVTEETDKQEKVNLSSFIMLRANSISNTISVNKLTTTTDSKKSKQDEIKKWMLRI